MKPQTGILLRMLGPLIEVVCAAALAKTWNQGYTVAGTRLETVLMIGFAVGLMMVVAGLTMVDRPSRKARRSVPDLDLGLSQADRDPNP